MSPPSRTESPPSRRLRREQRTVEIMIRMYCAAHHRDAADPRAAAGEACPACAELAAYSRSRVEACPFAQDKPTCARCPVHCFRPEMREQIRAVMRYSGPRMTLRHPYLALRHLLDRGQPKT